MEVSLKVLVIHGSPHQGNTMKLTRKFEETMRKHGSIHFEYLSVNELSIGMCQGCFNCITKGEDFCPLQNDDVKLILKKMDEANGVVICAPTYMYNIPAVMKNLIDRLSYLGHRPRYFNKQAVVISTTCGIGLKESLQSLSFSTAGAWGFKLVGTLGAHTHPFYLDKKSRIKLDTNIEILAKKFYSTLTMTELPPVSFGEIMRFISMSKLSLYSKEMFPADYKFYHENKDLGERYYLKSAKIGGFTRIASQILALIMDRSMRKSRNKSDMHQKFLDW
jgi:multimeric flavodoxin WrbA